MNNLLHWFETSENALAVLVTVGVAFFVFCCLECSKCPCRDKDDIFRHHAM